MYARDTAIIKVTKETEFVKPSIKEKDLLKK